ncbi:MAG TPA: hypothetical protein VGO48_12230 [Conexibacter sp.]|jgi:hypothetical protein|nr:hypothetical protein [Conexibacter sp.]
MGEVLLVYVVLGIPALHGTLSVMHRGLDLYERWRQLRQNQE